MEVTPDTETLHLIVAEVVATVVAAARLMVVAVHIMVGARLHTEVREVHTTEAVEAAAHTTEAVEVAAHIMEVVAAEIHTEVYIITFIGAIIFFQTRFLIFELKL